eukprot:CAMPEP_0202355428 /NCGR_PEP_ID=MMETSP1126-20121109/10328_1 /ASSEMBLY_ACC=CAM_ASM_000457 /TAXON_ID=3047 /ORGANISM="Dunaliella tertiolecta, Strain CCMP1320" /LENGTH=366 /DNA_ID=CAMNT_0048948045 /DNA_START=775 /DNA_END=1875 /DNA_ORIENTATION=-
MHRDVAPFLMDVGQGPRWKATIFYYTLAALICYGHFLKQLWSFLKGPFKFFRVQDRSHLDKTDPVPGVVHDYVNANGIIIHAVSLKRQPHKPLMLFLHGFPEFWYTWRHQLKAFAEDYDAVAIDMRGYGDSSKPRGVHNYDLDLLAADISAVVGALGHRSATLVAHDWGGGVAWVVAGMFPEVVDRLVVFAGPHLGLVTKNASWSQLIRSFYILLFQAPLIPEQGFKANDFKQLAMVLKPGTPYGPVSSTAMSSKDIEWYKHAFGKKGAATATVNYYRALLPMFTYAPLPRVWDALRRIVRMPVCAVMADKDIALEPSLMDNLEKVAPVSETHILKDCSHWIPVDQPDTVSNLIREFCEKHPLKRD